jgi:transcriptional regulator with XRE-family HTH domain
MVQWERNFVEQMVRLREMRKMTQTDVAKALKSYGLPFHQQTIQRIETGERPVRLNEAHLIAKVLGVGLDVMTDTGTPSDREMRFAVDQLRRGSESAADHLHELLGEWLEAVESFAGVLSDRLEAADITPETDPVSTPVADKDPVAAWGLAWVVKTLSAHSALTEALDGLMKISGSAAGVRYEDDGEFATPDVVAALEMWHERYSHKDVVAAARTNPNELYAEFPGQETAASPHEHRLEKLRKAANEHRPRP